MLTIFHFQLINIITKAFRSKPIIVLEQKMSSRIRATRKSLAQDAIALRDLVNEIKLLKVKVFIMFLFV